jgi:hypothetical protein
MKPFQNFLIRKLKEGFDNDILINDKYILNLLSEFKFKIKIKNNNLEIIDDETLIYKNEYGQMIRDKYINITRIDPKFMLANLLLKESVSFGFLLKDKILILLPFEFENNKSESLLFQFNIVRNFSASTFNLLQSNIILNGEKVILSNDINTYPFLAFAPKLMLNFISINQQNKIGIHSLVYYNEVNQVRYNLYNVTKEERENRYIYLSIKDNYLTPIINNKKLVDTLYLLYDKYKYMVSYNKESDNYLFTEEFNLNILPKIEDILKITDENIQQILINISRTKIEPDNMHLVNWLNNEKVILMGDINKCDLKCDNVSRQDIEKIQQLINKLKSLLLYLTHKLTHNYENYMDFLNSNYESCSYIMRTNIYISNLIRLKEIIQKCRNERLSCHEILEINDLFNRHETKINKLAGLVEIIFGNIIRPEQWDKIYSIYKSFLNGDKYKVHLLAFLQYHNGIKLAKYQLLI